jgi:hypothetical protein
MSNVSRRFVNVFTTVLHWILSRAIRCILLLSFWLVSIVYYHLNFGVFLRWWCWSLCCGYLLKARTVQTEKQRFLWNSWVNAFSRKRIHATAEELCFLCGPCWRVIKRRGRSFKSVEFRDTSLPGYELGSKGIEMRNWGIRIIECNLMEFKVWLRRELYVCYSTTIYGVCNSVRLL